MLELVGDFLGRKKKCVGAGMSGGGPPGAHEARGRALGEWARPGPSWPGDCPPAMFSVPNILTYSRKNPPPSQTRVLAHLAAIFDLLAQSSIHKTALGDCSLVCDSSNGPISFCSSALFIANFYCLGDHVHELAC